jgi:hypothetical protein
MFRVSSAQWHRRCVGRLRLYRTRGRVPANLGSALIVFSLTEQWPLALAMLALAAFFDTLYILTISGLLLARAPVSPPDFLAYAGVNPLCRHAGLSHHCRRAWKKYARDMPVSVPMALHSSAPYRHRRSRPVPGQCLLTCCRRLTADTRRCAGADVTWLAPRTMGAAPG